MQAHTHVTEAERSDTSTHTKVTCLVHGDDGDDDGGDGDNKCDIRSHGYTRDA
jgi:hypothetical protein